MVNDAMMTHMHACMCSWSTHPFKTPSYYFLLKRNFVHLSLYGDRVTKQDRAWARSHMLKMTLALDTPWTSRCHYARFQEKTYCE
jgi:hypothetical protein